MTFTPADLALATLPGRNFDPASRSFSQEELKPQPIVAKRKKVMMMWGMVYVVPIS